VNTQINPNFTGDIATYIFSLSPSKQIKQSDIIKIIFPKEIKLNEGNFICEIVKKLKN
jgi:hypothetical protein